MTVFQYLDRWFTLKAGALHETDVAEQGTLLPGQTLKHAAALILDDSSWQPRYEGEERAPAAAPAKSDSGSNGKVSLARAPTMGTANNLSELEEWLQGCVDSWLQGQKPTPAELSHGHSLVYRTCAESSAPVNAEQKVYELYVDVMRRCVL